MPIYRSGIDMYKKYAAKYNPTVIGTRFGDVQQVALERAQSGLLAVGTVRDLVRPILDQHGVTGGMRAVYLAFATALWKRIQRSKGTAMNAIAAGLKSYYVTAYNASADILDSIISLLTGGAGAGT